VAVRISRREFLKLICVTGGAILFTSLMKLGKIFGANVTSTNATDIPDEGSKVGLDGYRFCIQPNQEVLSGT
jgi:hypothetical protein